MNRVYRTVRPAVAGLAIALSLPALALADADHGHSAAGAPGKAPAATRTVEIKLGDNFYEPGSVEVGAGETVRFVLKNGGGLLHEFNIGTAATHVARQREMAAMIEHGMLTPTGINAPMMKMDHGKMGMAGMKLEIPNGVFVEPGKTREFLWNFGEPATLEYACNMPGHYDTGMTGKVNFRK